MKVSPGKIGSLLLAAFLMGSNASAQITVDSTGNVGIGTTSPAAKLEVAGPAITGGPWESEVMRASSTGHSAGVGIDGWGTLWGVAIFQDGTRRFVLESNGGALLGSGFLGSDAPANGLAVEGNVGIGTTNPGFKFEVVQNGYNAIRATGNSTNAVGIYINNSVSGGNQWGITSSGGGPAPVGSLLFWDEGAATARMTLASNGQVGVGTTSPSEKLHVAGNVRATSFISDTTTYADFVFDEDYDLPALSEVEAHIEEHGHLPDIPSEAEAMANGIDLAAMQVKLLQKIEEMTLHQIRQEKALSAIQGEVDTLKAENARLRTLLNPAYLK